MKPTFPILQTGDALYTSLHNLWLFQQNGTDKKNNNSFLTGADNTFPVIDGYTLDTLADGLTLSDVIASGTTFSIAGRIKVRGITSPAILLGANGGTGLTLVTSTDGFKLQHTVTPNTTKLVFDTWYDFLFTYNGTTQKYYINGTLNGSSAQTILTANWDTGFKDVDGQLAWLGVWINRVLDATDAATLVTDPYTVARETVVLTTANNTGLGL